MKTIIRLYDDVSTARGVVQDLVDAGFDRRKITLMAYDPYGDYGGYVQEVGESGGEAALGAGLGGLIGGIGGLLLGLGALTIPGIGPIVAAGPIAAALLGAGTGATVGGLVGLLMEADVDEERATLYAEGVRRGGTLVVVESEVEDAQRAEEILDRGNPVTVEERAAGWRERGWRGYQAGAEAYSPDEVELERNFYTFEPVYRQHYDRTYASTGQPYSHYEPAYYYGYDLVARRGFYEHTWDEVEPEARQEWESRGQGAWDELKSAVQYAWQEAIQAVDMDEDYDDYEDWHEDFREHYQGYYASAGHPFERYDKAYRYGYDLAVDERIEGRNWDEIESDARREWEQRGEGLWDEVKDAVRHAWQEVKDALDAYDDDDYGYYDEGFRRHYETTYGTTGYPYATYDTAYRYGYDLARSPSYAHRDWEEIEPEARRNWEEQTDSVWDDVRDAVRHAWHEVRSFVRGESEREHNGNGCCDCEDLSDEFRRHYETNLVGSGYPYNRYEYAYHYGCELANDERYRLRPWDEVESQARLDWEGRGEGAWEDFRDAIRGGWREVKSVLSAGED